MGDPQLKANIYKPGFVEGLLREYGLIGLPANEASASGASNGNPAEGAGRDTKVGVNDTVAYIPKPTKGYSEAAKSASPGATALTLRAPIAMTLLGYLGISRPTDAKFPGLPPNIGLTVTERMKDHADFKTLYTAPRLGLIWDILEQHKWEQKVIKRLPTDIATKSPKEMGEAIDKVIGETANVKIWGDALREVEGVITHVYGEISGKLNLDFGELEDSSLKTSGKSTDKDVEGGKKEKEFGSSVHEGTAGLEAKAGSEAAPVMPTTAKVKEVKEAKTEAKDHEKVGKEAKMK